MKKVISVFLLFAFLIMSFVGCGSSPASTSEAGSTDVTEVTVTLFSQDEVYQEIFDQFNSSQDKIRVKFEVIPTQQLGTILNETLGTPDGVDITWGTIRTDMWANAGMIEPLDEYIERDGYDMDVFYPFTVAQNTINGHIYGIPNSVDTYAFALNTAVFDKYGVAYPEAGSAWSWEDVDALSRELDAKIKAAGGKEYAIALQITESTHMIIPMMVGNGAELFSDDKTKTLLNCPASEEILSMYASLIHDGVAADVSTVTETPVVNMISSNMAGISNISSFPSSLGILQQSENLDSIILMPWPTGPSSGTNNISNVTTSNYVMNSACPHKDAAWEVIKYMTSPEADAILSKARLSARKDNVDAWLNNFNDGLDYSIFIDTCSNFEPIELPNNQVGYLTQISPNLLPLWNGEITAQQALDNLEAAVNEGIAAGLA